MENKINKDLILYVAQNGNDNYSGKSMKASDNGIDGPFATIERARDAVRHNRNKYGKNIKITVMVGEGKYFLKDTIYLKTHDSGTKEYPVTYKAYGDSKPVLSGGVKITCWEKYKDNILMARIPECKGGKWKFRQLFMDGKPQIRSRYPKHHHDNPLHGGWLISEGCVEDGTKTGSKSMFKFKKGIINKTWSITNDVEVNIFAGNCVNYFIPIKKIDLEKNIITLSKDVGPYGILGRKNEDRFYFENILEELTRPGEWCLDSEEGILYFRPPVDSLEGHEVVVPRLKCLIDMEDTSWINIDGFKLTETLDGDDLLREGLVGYGAQFIHQGFEYAGEALHMKNTEFCKIQNNWFYGTGGNAIFMEGKSRRDYIANNEISYAGAYGLCIMGRDDVYPICTQIVNNHIHHTGFRHKYTSAIFAGYSTGLNIAHNYIHHLPGYGINLGTNGMGRNYVEYNELRFTNLEKLDAGAISCWMDMDDSGNSYYPPTRINPHNERSGHVIRFNLIADNYSAMVDRKTGEIIAENHKRKDIWNLSCGIYADDASSNCLIYGNIIIRAGMGIKMHCTKQMTIENNIIYDCIYQVAFANAVSHNSPSLSGFMKANNINRNIFVCKSVNGDLFRLDTNEKDMIGFSDSNLFYNSKTHEYRIENFWKDGGSNPLTLKQWNEMGYDIESIIADPDFIDADNEDFRLKPDSPAFKIGFVQINTGKIGIKKISGEEENVCDGP